MKKICFFSLLICAFCSLHAAVSIEHKQTRKGSREYNSFKILNASPVKYVIDYNISERKGKKTVGDSSASSTGIGLNNGWYGSATLRIGVNGKSLTSPAKISKNAGTLTFTWDEAVLKMTFPEGSDKIFCHVSAPGAQRLTLGFLGMPGFLAKRKTEMKSWVSTEKVNHFLNDGKYQTRGEVWYMFYDRESNRRGIPVVLLDPSEVKSGNVTGGAKRLLIVSSFEMKKSECRFLLMGIPSGHMDAETLYEDLKANGGKYLEQLKNFQFK